MSITGRTSGGKFAVLYPQPSRVVEVAYVSPSPGFLTVSPLTNFSSAGNHGGPFSPASKVYTITNTGGLPLDWSAVSSAFWCFFNLQTGLLNPGASVITTLQLDPAVNSMANGNYTGVLSFINNLYPANTVLLASALAISAPP